ncbi:Protein of unknown function (DUF3592) [Micromonospora viridifaciens]|uniref:DUF3592 domain-containing protein n=1 Tax=Micromonospora viridifaciens TaxID=1881 RepID=A0A1C4VAL4_MICVI|nr:DUF3592 domain-containing protein [Micromonospora viridifaciens]SCE80851.1 Protein of unknown function (DUF3592) [Micromonospora viridifaciens]
MPLVVLLVMSGLGLIGMTYGTVRFWRDRRLLREGPRVPGEVVDLVVTRHTSGESYAPVVRFRTTDGTLVTSSAGRWRQTSFKPDGSQVTVVYDPSRPSRILVVPIGGTGTESVVVPFLVLVGLSAAIAGGGVYVFQTF